MLVFAHGGGYVKGDRRLDQPSYYDNVVLWAVRRGFVGITMSYRLLPQHTFPSGPDDIKGVVAWIRTNIAAHRGDAAKIFLSGHSAGAAHIGSYLAAELQTPVKGAIFCSGVYDNVRMEKSPRHLAYFGEDRTVLPERSSKTAVARGKVPIFVVSAEYDPQKFMIPVRAVAR